ncbi:hypothetical protein LCGC14_3073080 [marine sediment metagenome]|uniref:Uncharacterized protein n=1 Tax=marine sediment metagenome TaxID=412755 RepID=A0A0F8WG69_9ZZZZ
MWPFARSEEDREKDRLAQEASCRIFTYCCVCDIPFKVDDLIIKLYQGEKHAKGVIVRNSSWTVAFAHIRCEMPTLNELRIGPMMHRAIEREHKRRIVEDTSSDTVLLPPRLSPKSVKNIQDYFDSL